jgi:hypothetical protein
MSNAAWPELRYDAWKDTYATLHRWMQVVGKIRLARMPWLNHTWQVTLYPTICGLTTGRMPYGNRALEIEFDFVAHELRFKTSEGKVYAMVLRAVSVAQFYDETMHALTALGMPVSIRRMPCEIPDAVPFDEDTTHRTYDADYANRCWRALASTTDVLNRFRSRWYGKASPVHFFWGAFDLAVTRFSGRRAPEHPGGVPGLADRVVRDAYSHEVSSAGFWPGSDAVPYPLYYSYAYPEPAGFAAAKVAPAGARYDTTLHEFVLPYDDVRQSNDPPATLLAFLQSTYEAAADRAGWDRAGLEVPEATIAAHGGA